MDRWFKRIWLINGVLILIALLIVLLLFVAEQKKNSSRRQPPQAGPQVAATFEDSLVTQDISLALPVRIGTTDFVYIAIGVKDLARPTATMVGMEPSQAVNLIFCKADGTAPRLLLERKAYILGTDIPSARDTLQDFNLYRIVVEDTDGDMRLTAGDSHHLYISNVDGTGLSPVLPEGVYCTQYSFDPVLRRLILVTRTSVGGRRSSEDQPEELLVYDLEARTVRPFMADEEVVKQARRILWDQ